MTQFLICIPLTEFGDLLHSSRLLVMKFSLNHNLNFFVNKENYFKIKYNELGKKG